MFVLRSAYRVLCIAATAAMGACTPDAPAIIDVPTKLSFTEDSVTAEVRIPFDAEVEFSGPFVRTSTIELEVSDNATLVAFEDSSEEISGERSASAPFGNVPFSAVCVGVGSATIDATYSEDPFVTDTLNIECTEETCGNDIAQFPTESCDGMDLRDETCETLNLGSGELSCTTGCELDTSACEDGGECGNQVVERALGEQCEIGDSKACSEIFLGSGRVECTDDCVWDTSDCSDGGRCGNDVAEMPEQCDGIDLGRRPACTDHGFGSGTVKCTNECEYDSSDCGESLCGNGRRDPTEACEDDDFGRVTCESLGFFGGASDLECTDDCEIDSSGCNKCGNGEADDGEDCDGGDVREMTCEDFDFDSGSVSCSPLCTFDLSGCFDLCGNGDIDDDEECDGAEFGDATCESETGTGFSGSLSCNDDCTIDTSDCSEPADPCGNGDVDPGEECDGTEFDGETCASLVAAGFTGTLECRNDCTIDTSDCNFAVDPCGDGNIDVGEECDGTEFAGATCDSLEGAGYTGTLECRNDCTIDSSDCTPPSSSGTCVTELGNWNTMRIAQCGGEGGAALVIGNALPAGTSNYASIDHECNVVTDSHDNNTGPGGVACNRDNEKRTVVNRASTNELRSYIIDEAGVLGSPTAFGANSGSFYMLAPTQGVGGSDTALLYYASGSGYPTVRLLDDAAQTLTTYTSSSAGTTGTVRRMFVDESGPEPVFTGVFQTFGPPVTSDPVSGALLTAVANTTTATITHTTYLFGSWANASSADKWDVALTNTGFDTWVLPTATLTFDVTPVASPAMTAGTPVSVTTSNGTPLDFKVASNGTTTYFAGIVEVDSVSHLLLLDLGATRPGNIDFDQATDLGEFSGRMQAMEVSAERVSLAVDDGSSRAYYYGWAIP